ncbi:MAG: YbaK/EbsC family protein [bacterium]|nr:YbaK/EbsC family protein [bacterium]
MPVFERIKEFLDTNGVHYDLREHPAVYTSQEAAAARGCELRQGAKSLVLHVTRQRHPEEHGDEGSRTPMQEIPNPDTMEGRRYYILAVISAVRQADFEKLKQHLGAKKVRLCTPDEALKVTGCTVGSVPPFGNLLDLPTYVDPSLGENETIAFNPGSHTHSILMKYDDYARIVQPDVVAFAKSV